MGFYGIGVLGTILWGLAWGFLGDALGFKPEGPAMLLLFVPVFVAGLLALTALSLRRRAVDRERRWLAGLPFAVDGYESTLCNGYKAAKLTFSVRHEHQLPASSLLLDLTCAVWPRAKQQDGTIGVNVSWSDSDYWGGRSLRRAFHRLVDRVLLPLHAKHARDD
jgi:hypothetical protein